MKTRKKTLAVVLVVMTLSTSAFAFTVYDPINSGFNQIRNTILTLQHAESFQNAMQRLAQLRGLVLETIRFNSGVDEIKRLITGDYRQLSYRYNPSTLINMGFRRLNETQRDFFGLLNGVTSATGSDFRYFLNSIFGEDPQSEERPYITQEELLVADSFRWASQIRGVVEPTVRAGEDISRAAQSASPKGAARLTADVLGKVLVTQAQIQENQAKQIELAALQAEQVSRDEKELERARQKYMNDFDDHLDSLLGKNQSQI